MVIAIMVNVNFRVHRSDQILLAAQAEIALLVGGALGQEVVRCNCIYICTVFPLIEAPLPFNHRPNNGTYEHRRQWLSFIVICRMNATLVISSFP